MADFTSWGPLPDYTLKPDVSAPGVDIISTGNDNKYVKMNGTSMATPFNSGVAVLVIQRLKKTFTWCSFSSSSEGLDNEYC